MGISTSGISLNTESQHVWSLIHFSSLFHNRQCMGAKRINILLCPYIPRPKVLHVESVILKNTEHDHLFLPWFAWVVNFFIYLSLPFLSPFLFIWMNWQDNTVLIENCSPDEEWGIGPLVWILFLGSLWACFWVTSSIMASWGQNSVNIENMNWLMDFIYRSTLFFWNIGALFLFDGNTFLRRNPFTLLLRNLLTGLSGNLKA